jgi:hypothetical protein
MKQIAVITALALFLGGCGDGDSTSPPSVPDVAGTYSGAFTVSASSSAGNQNLGTVPATATVTQRGADLSIAVVGQQGESFTTDGTIAAGGAIDLNNDPDLSFLAAALPQCSFTDAAASNSGSVTGGTLVLTASVVGASCPWGEADGTLLPTSFQIRFEGS